MESIKNSGEKNIGPLVDCSELMKAKRKFYQDKNELS
jgi:hypothetical protein